MNRWSARWWRWVAVVASLGLAAAACSVDAAQVAVELSAPSGSEAAVLGDAEVSADADAGGSGGVLPALGPVPNTSHWHAAYVVRVCGDVLEPFDSDADPLGIHSHNDGLMHIHPFVEEAGYENATLGVFADAMGFALSDGELTLPGGGTWRDGDLCDGVPGRVFVDRWSALEPDGSVERIFSDVADIRYLADSELYHIAFAPEDALPVVPPSLPRLSDVTPVPRQTPEPWVDVDPASTLADVTIWSVASVSAEPCNGAEIPERVRVGEPACYEPGSATLDGSDVIVGARAVLFNREPAVELSTTPLLYNIAWQHFLTSQEPLTIAIEIGGFVISAPQLQRPPATQDRLLIAGGFSIETAQQLAHVMNS